MKLFRLILFLISSNVFCQDIRINELVASNSIIFDEDGDTPDWIELYNYGSTPVSLINWSISDEEITMILGYFQILLLMKMSIC